MPPALLPLFPCSAALLTCASIEVALLSRHYMRSYPALAPASVKCANRTSQCPGLVGVVSLNCTHVPGCTLSGLTMIATSGYEGAGAHVPAVRVWQGKVDSVTILSSQLTGATDVVDGDNVPVGAWVSRSGGGFTIVGTANDTKDGTAVLTAAGGSTHRGDVAGSTTNPSRGHALLVGESGERGARLAIETTGALRWGTGRSASFDTTLKRYTSNVTAFEPPLMAAGAVHATSVLVSGAAVEDVATASMSTLGDSLVMLSARVAAAGRAVVLFHNVGPEPVKMPAGLLRVVLAKFE